MANFKGLTEIILTTIDTRVKPTTFPIASSAAIQSGQHIPQGERVVHNNEFFTWGKSAWGLVAISPIYKPEQPVK